MGAVQLFATVLGCHTPEDAMTVTPSSTVQRRGWRGAREVAGPPNRRIAERVPSCG